MWQRDLALDTLHRLTEVSGAAEVPMDPDRINLLAPAVADAVPGSELSNEWSLDDLLDWAVRREVVSSADARLLAEGVLGDARGTWILPRDVSDALIAFTSLNVRESAQLALRQRPHFGAKLDAWHLRERGPLLRGRGEPRMIAVIQFALRLGLPDGRRLQHRLGGSRRFVTEVFAASWVVSAARALAVEEACGCGGYREVLSDGISGVQRSGGSWRDRSSRTPARSRPA